MQELIVVGLTGYAGDFREIEDLQSYWEQLDNVARIEVLRHVINEQCRSWRTPPPSFRATAEVPQTGGDTFAGYSRRRREIIFFIRVGATEDNIPAIQRIDLALETVLHETAHHIDWMFRMEERSLLLSGRKTSKAWRLARNAWYNMSDKKDIKNPHPHIYATGTQWMNEYLSRDADFLMKTMEWIDRDRSWYHPQLEENLRDPDVRDFRDIVPPVEIDSTAPDDQRMDEIHGRIDPAVLDMRHWLRNPDYWIDDRAPIGLHRRYVRDIWDTAMRLTKGDPVHALAVAAEGVRPDRAPEENRRRHEDRRSGLPTRAFGKYRGFTGIDKLQGFFIAAARSYIAGEREESLSGWFAKTFELIGSLFEGDGQGADYGTLWADALGVSFGAALRWNPDEPIVRFLQTVPAADEALPIRMDARFREGYISDIVIPAPESFIKGYPVEVRAVDADNYAYTMNLSFDPESGDVIFDDARRSAYRLSHDDPWYFSGAPEGSRDDGRIIEDRHGFHVEPSSAYRAVSQQLRSHQEMQDRMLDNLGDLQANQRRLEDQMAQQRLTEEQMRRNEQQRQEMQRRIEDTHAQLDRNAAILNDLQHHRSVASNQMHDTLMRQTQDQGLLQQLEQQRQRHVEQMERSGRDQLDQQERQRRADERQREREQEARDEQQRRDQNRLNDPFVWTFGHDRSHMTVGGSGANIVVNPPHQH